MFNWLLKFSQGKYLAECLQTYLYGIQIVSTNSYSIWKEIRKEVCLENKSFFDMWLWECLEDFSNFSKLFLHLFQWNPNFTLTLVSLLHWPLFIGKSSISDGGNTNQQQLDHAKDSRFYLH